MFRAYPVFGFRVSAASARFRASAASALLLGAALAAVAFGAAGGTTLGRTTTVELALVVAGALVAALAVLFGRPGRLDGAGSLVAFAALAALTALSVIWSVAPDLSFVEAGRTLAYLAVFAGAVAAARLAPRRAPVVLGAVLIGAAAVLAYALASRVWPAQLAADELATRVGNRIDAPYGYWNAVGSTAALAVPAGLWLASRRAGHVAVRALAYPVLGAAFVAIMLTQSRGALAAAALAALGWFALVPLRLRSLPALILPALAAAPMSAWALSKDAFAKAFQPMAVKDAVAGEFGLLLLLMVLALLGVGLAVTVWMDRAAPSPALRRRVGIAAIAAACAVPLALVAALATSERGLGGTIDQRVHELTSESDTAPTEGAGRFAATASVRSSLWREAGHIFGDHPAAGTGAGTFAVSRLRYRKTEQVSRHAHGFVVQTLADTGLVGLAVTLALLVAWLVAAARTTLLYPRGWRLDPRAWWSAARRLRLDPRRWRLDPRRLRLDPRGWWRRRAAAPARPDWTPDRVALVALTLVAIAFGLQSAIDWTWFVPGPTVMALLAAGFVAGRGPRPAPAGQPEARLATAPGVGAPAADEELAAAGASAPAEAVVGWSRSVPEREPRPAASAGTVSALESSAPFAATEPAAEHPASGAAGTAVLEARRASATPGGLAGLEPAPQGAGAMSAAGSPPATVRFGGVELVRPTPARIVAAVGIAVTAILCAWAIWQPEASDRAANRGLELIARDQPWPAAVEAAKAEDANPLSPKPLLVLADAQTSVGDLRSAQRTLERAVLRFPSQPQTWLRLASFQLVTLDRPDLALSTLRAVLYIDPKSKAGAALVAQAQTRLAEKQSQAARQAPRR